MADAKDEGQTGMGRKPPPTTGPAPGTTGAARRGAGDVGSVPATVAIRRRQYLIGLRPQPGYHAGYAAPGAPPLSIDAIAEHLGRHEDIEIVRRIKPGGTQPFG